jgi:hypothetical protein
VAGQHWACPLEAGTAQRQADLKQFSFKHS